MIRDIMVHLDATEGDTLRLAHAAALAETFKAHLTGLLVNSLPGFAMSADASGTGTVYMAELVEQAVAEGDVLEKEIATRMNRLAAPHDLVRVDAVPDTVGYHAGAIARYCDVFLATRPSVDGESGQRWMGLIEGVLFGSGRGLMLVPEGRTVAPVKRIVIAWNGSREATRAVAEAMPLLAKAARVVVVSAERSPGDDELDTRLARHLDRHGVKVTQHDVRAHDPADAILNEAGSVEADLIVMGAYGHSRLREWVLGGVTRDLLLRSPVPLFLAH